MNTLYCALLIVYSPGKFVDTASEEEIFANTNYGKVKGTRRQISVHLPGGKSTFTPFANSFFFNFCHTPVMDFW